MLYSKERLVLAESVVLVLEVKSDLSTQWEQLMRTTSKVKALNRRIKLAFVNSDEESVRNIPVIGIGYRGFKKLDTLKNKLDATDEGAKPDGLFVIENGNFYGFGFSASGIEGYFALTQVISDSILEILLMYPCFENYYN